MANHFDFRRRDAGPWSRTSETNWPARASRARHYWRRVLRPLGQALLFLAFGAFLISAALHHERGTFAAVIEPVRHAVHETLRDSSALPQIVRPERIVTGNYRAIDGDSLRNASGDTRIAGIDAVELRQTCTNASGGIWNCGRDAHRRLRALVSRGVDCRAEGRDRYGRTLARCYDGQRDIGETMVREGLAVDFMGGGYVAAEREARRAKRGIWAGEFDRPQDWRRRARARTGR